MAERMTRTRGNVTRGKLILIGVLGIVLVAVLYAQFGGAGSATEQYVRKPMPAPQADPEQPPAAGADEQEQQSAAEDDAARRPVDNSAWNPPDLATVIAYDPFAVPDRFPQPRSEGNNQAVKAERAKQEFDVARAWEETRKQLDEMRQLGVKVILKQQDHYVALIGDQTIRVGDEINGFTVTEITPTGVRVERKIEE